MKALSLLICSIAALAYCVPTARARTEHLLFHELNDDIVAVTAAYSAHRSAGGHDTTFPRSISSLLDSFPVRELNLTLTRGRWREEWCDVDCLNVLVLALVPPCCPSAGDIQTELGLPRPEKHLTYFWVCRGAGVGPTAPPGATLSVAWHPSIRFSSVHTMWSGVTNALSGLLCTSLSTLAPAQMYTTRYVSVPGSTPALQTFGALSHEAVCTENLAGLSQMLPCGGKFGTAKLLDPSVLFSSPFHSMNLRARAFDGPPAGVFFAVCAHTNAEAPSELAQLASCLKCHDTEYASDCIAPMHARS